MASYPGSCPPPGRNTAAAPYLVAGTSGNPEQTLEGVITSIDSKRPYPIPPIATLTVSLAAGAVVTVVACSVVVVAVLVVSVVVVAFSVVVVAVVG